MNGPSNPPGAQLADLLTDLFDLSELDDLVRRLPETDGLRLHLGAASRAGRAAEIVEGLGRRGRLDESFWATLRQLRAGRVADIDAVEVVVRGGPARPTELAPSAVAAPGSMNFHGEVHNYGVVVGPGSTLNLSGGIGRPARNRR